MSGNGDHINDTNQDVFLLGDVSRLFDGVASASANKLGYPVSVGGQVDAAHTDQVKSVPGCAAVKQASASGPTCGAEAL